VEKGIKGGSRDRGGRGNGALVVTGIDTPDPRAAVGVSVAYIIDLVTRNIGLCVHRVRPAFVY